MLTPQTVIVYFQSDFVLLRFTVTTFNFIGENPIGDEAYIVLLPFQDEQSGLEGLSAAAGALERAILSAGFSFHRVSQPPNS